MTGQRAPEIGRAEDVRDRFADEAIERILLGGALNEDHAALAALRDLQARDIAHPGRRAIFGAIRKHEQSGAPLRCASVNSTLQETGWVSLHAEIAACFDEWMPSDGSQLEHLARRLKLLSRARSLHCELAASWGRLAERRDDLEERLREIAPKLREAIDQALAAAAELERTT